jgi:HNH endonuclease
VTQRGRIPCDQCGQMYEFRDFAGRNPQTPRCCSRSCRFWIRVQRGAPDECWPWLGVLQTWGYGAFTSPVGQSAHRFAYFDTKGPIPPDRHVLHSCHNRRCVNPAHLRLGTAADNMHDMVEAGRQRKAADFWSYVERRSEKECWAWLGYVDSKGFGTFEIAGRKSRTTARLAWELTRGPIARGYVVRHDCGNRTCCNPAHLRLWRHADYVRAINQGENNKNTKLTADAVRSIRRDPRSTVAIAAEYGLTRATVSKLRLRQSWKHVE